LAGQIARMEERNVCMLLERKLEGKRPLESPRRMLVDNIKMDLGEMGRSGMDWIGLPQDKAVINLRVP
jgi:hypothetical protein